MSSAGSRPGSPIADYDGSSRTRQNEGSVGEGHAQDTADLSDDESILSEVDEAQFENFDPENVAIEDRPALAIDEENLKLIGRHKRKRPEDGDDTDQPKKKKEGRREKKGRRQRDSDDAFSGGDDAIGKRTRKKKGRERKRKEATPEAEELLDPATSESRIRAFLV